MIVYFINLKIDKQNVAMLQILGLRKSMNESMPKILYWLEASV